MKTQKKLNNESNKKLNCNNYLNNKIIWITNNLFFKALMKIKTKELHETDKKQCLLICNYQKINQLLI